MKTKLSALTLAIIPLLTVGAHASAQPNKSTKSVDENSILVVFKKGTPAAVRAQARSLVKAKIRDLNSDGIDDRYKHILGGRLANFKLSEVNQKVALEALSKHPAVEYAEPDYQLRVLGIPDDTRFAELWGMNNTGQTGGVADADIDAVEAWDITTGSSEIIVGVIDTGVDYNHPDLQANMWVNPGEIAGDGIDNDGNGYIDDVYGINAIAGNGDPMDDQGHGSHVSGTLGASGNNTQGVVGVNHEVSIAGCKFLSSAGTGSTSDAIECVDYFVALKNAGHNIRVTNNSWGGGGYSQALADSITASENADILFVAAAGNDGVDNDVNPHYPSSYEHDSILAVANTTHTDEMAWDSQWGLTSVDMGAPGSAILSTVPGGGYASYSGTSMATPHVAGAAALVLSINPNLTALELKQLLMSSGDANANLAGLTVAGTRLNVHQALLDADPEPSFRLSVAPRNQEIVAGENASYELSIGSIAQWQGVVELSVDSPISGAVLSSNTAQPGESVTLTVPTTEQTTWGDYSVAINAVSGDLEQQEVVGLYVLPQGLTEFSYQNDTPMAIPDTNSQGITSTITINDDITVFDTNTFVDITHTWIGDLIVTLTSPSGTMVTLHNRSGGSADDINETYNSAAFNGEVATGDWTLFVSDNASSDTGTLNAWSLNLTGIGEVSPQPPQAGFTFTADGLNVQFSDASTDVNGDIVSWMWDFGDGATSSDASPTYTYAESGTYSVALTVTDSEGYTDTVTQQLSVSSDVIELELVRANKTRLGYMRVQLGWEGSSADSVNIYRNGELISTTDNTGKYLDFERRATESSYSYQVCQSVDVCSNEVTVTFD